jgi:hypothetical protein
MKTTAADLADGMKMASRGSVTRDRESICAPLGLVTSNALRVTAVNKEEVVNSLANPGGEILLWSEPPTFGCNFRGVQNKTLKGCGCFLSEHLPLINDFGLVEHGSQLVQAAVSEGFPFGGVVGKPLEEVRDGVRSNCVERCGLFHCKLSIQSDYPLAEGLAFIGRLRGSVALREDQHIECA